MAEPTLPPERRRGYSPRKIPMKRDSPPLRPLVDSDAPVLWEMLYQAIHVPEGQSRPPRDILTTPSLAVYVQGWGRPGDLGFAALDSTTETIVGAAWCRLFADEAPGYGFVDSHTPELSVALLPEHRGRGIGSRLLARLLERVAVDHRAISLSVDADNRAFALYRRLGFKVVAEHGEARVMLKELGPVLAP